MTHFRRFVKSLQRVPYQSKKSCGSKPVNLLLNSPFLTVAQGSAGACAVLTSEHLHVGECRHDVSASCTGPKRPEFDSRFWKASQETLVAVFDNGVFDDGVLDDGVLDDSVLDDSAPESSAPDNSTSDNSAVWIRSSRTRLSTGLGRPRVCAAECDRAFPLARDAVPILRSIRTRAVAFTLEPRGIRSRPDGGAGPLLANGKRER